MASNRTHHVSRSNRFTLVFAREEQAATARSLTLAPWQLVFAGLAAVFVIGASFYALVALTPLATYIPLPNPALENKYSRELLSLNQRVLGMMEELVRLRAYNAKLRNALGERVAMTDSGTVVEMPSGSARTSNVPSGEGQRIRAEFSAVPMIPSSVPVLPTAAEDRNVRVSFPAIIPAQGYITRGFGPDGNHYGLDIAGKTGSLVSAAADGTVLFAGWTADDGYMLILAHSGGFATVYKHNQSLLRSVNARVRRGESIATLGGSGHTSTGPHLHFEIWKDGTPVDPARYVINLAL